jgi:hypothetical protein
MDRPAKTPVAQLPGLDDASVSGWDPHTVWRERVRDPQLASKAHRSTQRITLPDHSAGWNPLETWRLLLQRPRKQPR